MWNHHVSCGIILRLFNLIVILNEFTVWYVRMIWDEMSNKSWNLFSWCLKMAKYFANLSSSVFQLSRLIVTYFHLVTSRNMLIYKNIRMIRTFIYLLFTYDRPTICQIVPYCGCSYFSTEVHFRRPYYCHMHYKTSIRLFPCIFFKCWGLHRILS